jgi:hypothetical protein
MLQFDFLKIFELDFQEKIIDSSRIAIDILLVIKRNFKMTFRTKIYFARHFTYSNSLISTP